MPPAGQVTWPTGAACRGPCPGPTLARGSPMVGMSRLCRHVGLSMPGACSAPPGSHPPSGRTTRTGRVRAGTFGYMAAGRWLHPFVTRLVRARPGRVASESFALGRTLPVPRAKSRRRTRGRRGVADKHIAGLADQARQCRIQSIYGARNSKSLLAAGRFRQTVTRLLIRSARRGGGLV